MNRMTVYDQTRLCFKVTPHQEPGRSVIQELGIYEDIHEEEIKKARNITDIRDLYFTKGAKLDPYWENLGKPKKERSGWIPVSERLPEEPYGCLVTVEDEEPMTGQMFETILPYHVGWDGERWNDSDGEQCPFEVTAWIPLPKPYKAESEVNTDEDSD